MNLENCVATFDVLGIPYPNRIREDVYIVIVYINSRITIFKILG